MWNTLMIWLGWAPLPDLSTQDEMRIERTLGAQIMSWRDANPYDLVGCERATGGCLYIGNIAALEDEGFVRKMGGVVTAIDVMFTPPYWFHQRLGDKPHLLIDIIDYNLADMRPHFNESYQFIDNLMSQGRDVFVHCAAGKSRSATIVLYYLMRRYGMSLEDALAFLKSRRPLIRPNRAFLAQLAEQERIMFSA